MQDEMTYERVGNTWVFADGTVVPVVSGGSDTGELGGDPAAAGGGPAAGGGDPAAAAGGAGGETEPSGENWDEGTRTYIEKLRGEAAGYRTRAKEYEDVFGNIDPEDRKVWLGMAKTMYSDPKAGAEWMAKVAAGVAAGLTQEQAEDLAGSEPGAKPGAEGEDRPLTRAELEQWYSDRRASEKAAADQEATIKGINDEAAALGYKEDTTAWNNLLWLASRPEDKGGTGGDLKKAHELLEAERQAVIDAYVADKANGGGLAPSGDGFPPAGGQRTEIKSLEDSHKAAKARIEAIAAGGEAGGLAGTGRRGRGRG